MDATPSNASRARGDFDKREWVEMSALSNLDLSGTSTSPSGSESVISRHPVEGFTLTSVIVTAWPEISCPSQNLPRTAVQRSGKIKNSKGLLGSGAFGSYYSSYFFKGPYFLIGNVAFNIFKSSSSYRKRIF